MIIPTILKKHLNKIHYPFIIKTQQIRNRRECSHYDIKGSTKKTTAKIMLDGERLYAFPITQGTKQGSLLSQSCSDLHGKSSPVQ